MTKNDAVKVYDADTLAENMGNEKGTTEVARVKFNATALPVVLLEDNDSMSRRSPLTKPERALYQHVLYRKCWSFFILMQSR